MEPLYHFTKVWLYSTVFSFCLKRLKVFSLGLCFTFKISGFILVAPRRSSGILGFLIILFPESGVVQDSVSAVTIAHGTPLLQHLWVWRLPQIVNFLKVKAVSYSSLHSQSVTVGNNSHSAATGDVKVIISKYNSSHFYRYFWSLFPWIN